MNFRIIIILFLSYLSNVQCLAIINSEDIDSIAVIVKPKSMDRLNLTRSNFVKEYLVQQHNRIPIYVSKEKSDISTYVNLLRSDILEEKLSFNTDAILRKLHKTDDGDYDIKGGFHSVDNSNVCALIVIFKSIWPTFIWIGEDYIDIGAMRYKKNGIYNNLLYFINKNFD